MKERSILFSDEMGRAILQGRKTQTRRICKPAQAESLSFVVNCGDGKFGDEEGDVSFACPFGVPGDRLWARESGWERPERTPRMTLEVTDVRVERLHDMSYDDCTAEGIKQKYTCINPNTASYANDNDVQNGFRMLWDKLNAPRGFSWDMNPWVWVISFRRVK